MQSSTTCRRLGTLSRSPTSITPTAILHPVIFGRTNLHHRPTIGAIADGVALLTTQGRALGITVRGYVQEPTKETVPVRELLSRGICMRVTSPPR